MRSTFIVLAFIFIGKNLYAQDSLWVNILDAKPMITYKAKNVASLFEIAKRYAIPPAVLSDINNISIQKAIPAGTLVRIPIDSYNYIKDENEQQSRPIFYRVTKDDNLVTISQMFKVSQGTIQKWNNMPDTKLKPDKVLKIGWISYDKYLEQNMTVIKSKSEPVHKLTTKPLLVQNGMQKKELPKASSLANVSVGTDTTENEDKPTAFALLYEQQTLSMDVNEESGAAVFYDLKIKAPEDAYYAFHNTATKGSILKITNPANGKAVFAKVIGIIPNLKEYHNALVGLSDNAASVLGARGNKMFCNLKYR